MIPNDSTRAASALAATALLLLAGLAGVGCGTPSAAVPATPGPAGTFPAPPRSTTATIWAVGDGADGSRAARAVARLIARSRPTRLLYLGDVYPSGSAADFRDHYDPVYGALRGRTLPTPGNHEWPSHATGYDRYWGSVTGGRPPSFYAVRVAGWTVLSLNSEEPLGRGSRQGRWLARQLATPGTCRVAFWHRPRYSAGLHGDQADVAPLWNAVRGRAALVLNGHDHDMQQLRASAGTTTLIAGAGGHGRYPTARRNPRVVWSNASSYGALRLRLAPRRASFAFVSTGGTVLHRGSSSCARR